MKRIKISLLCLLLFACSLPAAADEPTPAITPTLPDPAIHTDEAPDPEGVARAFLDAWKARDYEEMFALLSPLAQDGLSLEAFQELYQSVWRNGALSGVEYEILSSFVQSPQQAQVRYRITLESLAAGPVSRETWMNLTRVDSQWRVAWNESVILPEMEGGRNLYVDVVTPTRTNVYDRNGLALATQADAVALWMIPNQIGGEDSESAMLSALRRLLDFPSEEAIQQIYEPIRDTDFRVVLGSVTLDAYQQFSGTLESVGGIGAQIYNTRLYPEGGLAPHAVGYVGWIQEEVLDEYLAQGYRGDEFVGQMGLEYWYEDALRGQPGGTLYLTGPDGNVINVLGERDPEPPYAVYSTLDRELQRHTQQAIEDHDLVGAVVVLERDTGAVLAMASSPSFDPNIFDTANPNFNVGIQNLFSSDQNPLINRATVGAYAPGSTFKMITMAAALESGGYDPDTVYNCGLEWTEIPGLTLVDWRLEKELGAAGEISLIQALQYSCNPYFYHIGLDLFNQGQPAALSDMARGFGLGQLTGIEIAESAGLVPDPEYKEETVGEAWLGRDSVSMAIGQSFLQVTPLQMARYVAALGNGGTLYRPHLVNRVQNAEGEILEQTQPEAQGTLPISPETLDAIQQGMLRVVRDPNGTAYRRFLNFNLNIAGKTGTAQTGDFTDPHAWFAGYTFEEREGVPDIAVAVLIENQGEGSDWAAPVFRRVVESYFFGQPVSVYPWEARIRVPRTETPTPEPEDESEAEETATPEP